MSRKVLARKAHERALSLMEVTRSLAYVVCCDPDVLADTHLRLDDAHVNSDSERTRVLSESVDGNSLQTIVRFSGQMGASPASDYVKLRRWARTKVIYTVHEHLYAALRQTDWSSTVIPGQVLLPHPVTVPVSDADAQAMRLVTGAAQVFERYEGFTVTGLRDRWRCSSDDPAATGLVLTFFARIVDEPGREIRQQFSDPCQVTRTLTAGEGMSLLVSFEDATMAQRQQFARDRLRSSYPQEMALVSKLADELIDASLSLLVYLVTDEVDSSSVPSATTSKKARSIAGPAAGPAQVVQVGFRVGPSLARAVGSHGPSAAPGAPTRTVRPHVRRGHVRRVAHGPGRELRKLVWIAPVVVNAATGALPTQVHVRDR